MPATPKTPKMSSTPLILRYRKNRFILENAATASTPVLTASLLKNPFWKKDEALFITDDLGAAAKYRAYADNDVERIFKRRFQTHYVIPVIPELPLDPHQVEGLKWILSRKRSYLAHAPGAGKTAQAILAACLARHKGYEQSLFIVPPTLVKNWEREIWKFTDWLDIFPTIGIVGNTQNRDTVAWHADFVICPDSMIAKDWVHPELARRRWKLIAVDEASRLKEATADRSLAFYGGVAVREKSPRHYLSLYQNARHVVFLDGSPMPNRPMELWAPTFALHPEAIGCMDQNDFGYRYCGARPNERGQWEFLYSSNETELKERLQKDFMHVVPEEALSHPERRRKMLFMSRDVRSLEQKTWERKHLSGITDIGELANQGEIARYRRELGIRKVPWIARYVSERLEKNESILLFAWHREVCEKLQIRLARFFPGLIIGGVANSRREHYFDEFQRGRCQLLILNIAAGGRGHNLQRTDRAIFGEWSWTDENNKQCEKRGSRRGSEKSVLPCDYIVCPDSLDERTLSSVFTKEKRVKRVIG